MGSLVQNKSSESIEKTSWGDPDLLSLLVSPLQVPGPLSTARHNLLPPVLDTGQQVFDEDHILFLTEVFQVSPHLVQGKHHLSVAGHIFL